MRPEGVGLRLAVQEFFVEGPLARHVEDLRNPVRSRRADRATTYQRYPRSWVLAFSSKNHPEVDAAVQAAADTLAAAAYDVVEVDALMLGEAASLWRKLALPDFDNLASAPRSTSPQARV